MNEVYRFKLNNTLVNPLYDDKLTRSKERDSGQMFFRTKLNGTIALINDDFDFLNAHSFNTEFILTIEYKIAGVWQIYYQGSFTKTDCVWDYDAKKVTLSTTPLDEYTKILGLLDKEVDLIQACPAIQPVYIRKRPLIQIYTLGTTVISNFIGGTTLGGYI